MRIPWSAGLVPARIFFAGRDLLQHIGEDVGEHAHDVFQCRRGGVAEDELFDVLRVRGGVGHGEQAAVRVANEIEFLEAEFGANSLHVGDLGVHAEGCVRGDAFGFSGAALVIEDDLAIMREARPHIVLQHVDVRKAGTAVGDDNRRGGACRAKGLVSQIDVRRWDHTRTRRFLLRESGAGEKQQRCDKSMHKFSCSARG